VAPFAAGFTGAVWTGESGADSSGLFRQTKIGFGFNGEIAPAEIRDKYINKSIAHLKKKGAASAIRYNL